MTSEFPGSSSAQKPHAGPQPAHGPSLSQAASPPTKQSLKSWWKTFRPPQKAAETHGNFHLFCITKSFEQPPPLFPAARVLDRKGAEYVFKESAMNEQTPAREGTPECGEAAGPADTHNKRFSLYGSAASLLTAERQSSRRHSTFIPDKPQKGLRPPQSGGVLPASAHHPDMSNKRASWNPFVAHVDSLSSDPLTIKPPASKGQLSRLFENFLSRNSSSFGLRAKSARIVQQPTGIFGVPLRQSITYANVAISLVDAEGKSYIYGYVPIVVAKCGVYLKEKATNVEGIFRLSGSEKRIKELRTIFDSPDRYGKGLDWAGYTVHDAANVLRRYLNQLPEPIVPLDLYERFREPLRGHTMQAVGDAEGPQLPDNFDVGKAISTYQQLITELPPLNRQLLLYILDLLAVFASKSDENRMNSQNLAAIFQPGMLSHPQHDMAPVEYRLSQDVLIFLIENQDHFLIGMRGTAADEQTVHEVQNGGTPPPGTPNTPGRSKNAVARSASNASAGADSVRKFGGVRRNVSVSSKHSRQSNGAPSPASPAYGASLTNSPSGGLGRSNTLPSKRSPRIPSSQLQKHSGSASPNNAAYTDPQNSPRGLSPSTRAQTQYHAPPSPGLPTTTAGARSLAPSSIITSAVASQERLLGEPDAPTPSGRGASGLFARSPTSESGEKRQPNKLRKKRLPGSSNPSAQSSTHSLSSPHPPALSPGLPPSSDVTEHPHLETIPSVPVNPALSNNDSTPPLTDTPRAEFSPQVTSQHEEMPPPPGLKPASPVSSVHSRSSFNETSDPDHHPDEATAAAEQKEKRSRWRLSRHRDNSQSLGHSLTPRKGLGSDNGLGASTSSIGSSRPRKSFTGDTIPVSSDTTLVNPHLHSSNESAPAINEEKKGPLGWFKKMREKREEKDEKERTKSPPASMDRLPMNLPHRGKSVDLRREEQPERIKADTIPQQSEQPPR